MRRAALFLLAALTALSLASCTPERYTSTFFAMDTVMELTVYGDGDILEKSEARIRRLEAELSVTDENSEIYALNRDGQAPLGEDAKSLLERALEICRLTGGALDITVYPLVRAWGFTTGQFRVPGRSELESLLEKVDHTKIDGLTLPDGVMVDLGAVAKGRTSDEVAKLWREAGVESGLINLGGNVYALGRKPDGTMWRVGIRDPFSDTYLAALDVEDRAVVTSGGYERYFEEGGVRYHHIIDPATGYPADSGLASVTVVGADGTLCDGLSTAFFVMGLDAASALWRKYEPDGTHPAFDAVFVTDGGEVYITEGLEGAFKPMNAYENAQIKVIRRG